MCSSSSILARSCFTTFTNPQPALDLVAHLEANRTAYLSTPYPGGESWQQAVDRVGSFLADLLPRWNGARVLVVGHVATKLGLDHHLLGVPLAELLAAEFSWQPGWEYTLEAR